MVLETGKKVYFLSDFHLGAPNDTESRKREDRLVCFLQDARKDAGIIFIVGDIFDFWFEYKTVVPKGFVRILGTLAQIADEGIQLHIFTGNHDLWMQDYLSKELNAKLYFEPQTFTIQNKQFLIGHGDGLGPGDEGWLILYTKEKAKTMAVDYFIFGHRHYAIDLKISDKSRYINLGDWIRLNTYAVFDGTDLQLLTWEA